MGQRKIPLSVCHWNTQSNWQVRKNIKLDLNCSKITPLQSLKSRNFRSRVSQVEASWNVMAHAQKPDFVFRAKRTSPFKSAGGRQFSRLLAAEVSASAVVMLDTPCSEVVWRVLATHSIRQFPLNFSSRASPCAITFQLEPTNWIQLKLITF